MIDPSEAEIGVGQASQRVDNGRGVDIPRGKTVEQAVQRSFVHGTDRMPRIGLRRGEDRDPAECPAGMGNINHAQGLIFLKRRSIGPNINAVHIQDRAAGALDRLGILPLGIFRVRAGAGNAQDQETKEKRGDKFFLGRVIPAKPCFNSPGFDKAIQLSPTYNCPRLSATYIRVGQD